MNTRMLILTALAVSVSLAGLAQQAKPSAGAAQQSAQEPPGGAGAILFAGPASVQLIEQRLSQAGYTPGNVDGVWNNQTSQAVRNFQRASGLEQTGNLNMRTLAALGMGKALLGYQREAGVDQQISEEAATQGGVPIYASPATVRQVQLALDAAGYQAGNTQGRWDPQTARAVKDFQQAQGMEPTGSLSLSTLSALGLGPMLNRYMQNKYNIDRQLAQEANPGPGAEIRVSPAGLRQIQQSLSQLGYKPGRINGAWNRPTSQALRNFQQARNLEPTGNVNTRTIRALGLGQVFADAAGIAGGPVYARPQQAGRPQAPSRQSQQQLGREREQSWTQQLGREREQSWTQQLGRERQQSWGRRREEPW